MERGRPGQVSAFRGHLLGGEVSEKKITSALRATSSSDCRPRLAHGQKRLLCVDDTEAEPQVTRSRAWIRGKCSGQRDSQRKGPVAKRSSAAGENGRGRRG